MANLRIVSTIGPNPLDEVQELFELYVKASPETRELLLKSSRRIANYSQFRSHVADYIRGFRFMDLPVELCLQIAEYAMSSNATHEWRWLSRQAGKQVGKFKGLHQVTALSRVSRKLYSETACLGWKLNRFVFKECLLGEDYAAVPGLDDPNRNKKVVSSAFDAYSFFKNKVSLKTLESIGVITLQAKGATSSIGKRHCRRLRQLATEMPTVQFRLELLDWDYYGYELDDEDNRTLTQNWRSVADFFTHGYQLRRWLGDNGYFVPSRNWRVFPTTRVG